MNDFHESLRQEAELHADRAFDYIPNDYISGVEGRPGHEKCSEWAIARQAYIHGAQAALNLLGRSATSEGHPPRVKVRLGPSGCAVGAESEKDFGYEKANPLLFKEYLSKIEHQSLRAADLLEIKNWKLNYDHCLQLKDAALMELSQEREARKANSAEISELTRKGESLCNQNGTLLMEIHAEREARKLDSVEIETLKKIIEILEEPYISGDREISKFLNAKLDAEREKNAKLSLELENLRKFRDAAKLDERTWQDVACDKNDKLKTERKKNAKLTAALEGIASCKSNYPGDCPDIAQKALAEAGK